MWKKTFSKKEVEEVGKLLTATFEHQEEIISSLRKRLEEYDKDEEIRRLKEELKKEKESSFISFSPKQEEANREAHKKHMESDCGNKWLYYKVIPTGFSKPVFLCCDKCGFKEEIKKF